MMRWKSPAESRLRSRSAARSRKTSYTRSVLLQEIIELSELKRPAEPPELEAPYFGSEVTEFVTSQYPLDSFVRLT